MTATLEKIYDEARQLPDELAREVLDFICFVEKRHGITPRSEGADAPDWAGFFERHTRMLDDAEPLKRAALYDERLR